MGATRTPPRPPKLLERPFVFNLYNIFLILRTSAQLSKLGGAVSVSSAAGFAHPRSPSPGRASFSYVCEPASPDPDRRAAPPPAWFCELHRTHTLTAAGVRRSAQGPATTPPRHFSPNACGHTGQGHATTHYSEHRRAVCGQGGGGQDVCPAERRRERGEAARCVCAHSLL